MDAQTCLKKLQYVGVLSFATVGLDGTPQIRCISAIHYEADRFYFFAVSCLLMEGYKYWPILDIRK